MKDEDTRKQRKRGKPTVWKDPGKIKNMIGLAIAAAGLLLLLAYVILTL